jgi:hypothetical protein
MIARLLKSNKKAFIKIAKEASEEAADDAKKYSIWGAVAFAVIMILYFALLFIGVFAAAAGY